MPATLNAPRSVADGPGIALPLPHRRFGRTEERVPVIGLGTAPAGCGLEDAEAVALFHAAIDRGVTYLDTAPGYERAQKQLGEVLPSRRDEVFLVTKAYTPSAAELISIHEQSLRDMRTDHADLLFSHCVGSFEPEQLLAPDGAFAGLLEAKRRGLARYIGFTAHHHTPRSARLLAAVASGDLDVDAVMLAMNYADRHTYGFEEQVLPLAEKLDLGIAAMKVFGGAKDMNYSVNRQSAMTASGRNAHSLAFRYALGLPGVAIAVIGMFTVDELERNIAWAQDWEPLTAEESSCLETEGRSLAAEWGAHFGPAD